MGEFKKFINEFVKVKRVKKVELSAKIYGSNIPLCMGIEKSIDLVINKIKEGYYLLENIKSYKTDIISPENLAKIEGATRDLIEGKKVKIGRSEYRISSYSTISSLTAEIEISGEEIDKPKKSPNKYDYWFEAQLIFGMNVGVLSRPVADAHSSGDEFGAYFDQKGKNVKILGVEGTIKENKPVVFWIQQHSSDKWATFKKGDLEYKKVNINRLFPRAFTKAQYTKNRVLAIK